MVEAVIVSALVLVVFGGLLVGIDYSLKLIIESRAKITAVALVNERMEAIRALSYNEVGTVLGFPAGDIPQNGSTTVNGLTYYERVLIDFVDAPEDGEAGADSNAVVTDYKRIKVEYSWQVGTNATDTVSVVSNIVPRSIETSAGGGSLRVNVFDANVQPLSGASVRLFNDTGTTTYDVSRTSDATGQALFIAPANADYEITVTGIGYSTDGTYEATTTNPNPTTLPVAILENDVSTMNFFIDELSDIDIRTISGVTTGNVLEPFDDTTGFASSSEVVVTPGELILSGGAGSYVATGTVYLNEIVPTALDTWDLAFITASSSASTSVRTRFYTGTSTFTLVPDIYLPGNAAGFTSDTINLSALDVIAYDRLTPSVELSTIDPNVTPEVLSIDVYYIKSETPLPNIDLTITGAKTIGTNASSAPIYKYTNSFTTDGTGDELLSDLEWDSYTVTVDTAGYDIERVCGGNPYVLEPGVTDSLDVQLVANAAHTLRVEVVDADGDAIAGATVDLTRSGFSESLDTGACGQVFFNSGVSSNTDYTLSVDAAGFSNDTTTDIEIDGDEVIKVTLATS